MSPGVTISTVSYVNGASQSYKVKEKTLTPSCQSALLLNLFPSHTSYNFDLSGSPGELRRGKKITIGSYLHKTIFLLLLLF